MAGQCQGCLKKSRLSKIAGTPKNACLPVNVFHVGTCSVDFLPCLKGYVSQKVTRNLFIKG